MPQLQVIDDPSVREMYASEVISVTFDGGTVRVTTGSRRVHGDTEVIQITGRTVLSLTATRNLAKFIAVGLEKIDAEMRSGVGRTRN